jgi:hypothetical protein
MKDPHNSFADENLSCGWHQVRALTCGADELCQRCLAPDIRWEMAPDVGFSRCWRRYRKSAAVSDRRAGATPSGSAPSLTLLSTFSHLSETAQLRVVPQYISSPGCLTRPSRHR